MKFFLCPALCVGLAAAPALAQQPSETTALGQEVMECVGGKVQLRSRIVQLEAELAKLKADTPAKPAP